MREKPLTNLKLSALLKEFKTNFYQSFWYEMEQNFKLLKKRHIEKALEEEKTFYRHL